MAIIKKPPLRIPSGWRDQARAFVIQLQNMLDDIYSKLGKGEGGSQTAGVEDINYSNSNLVKTVQGTDTVVVSTATLKTDMSLNNVENKSSATIRGEMTSGNVTDALGYTPLDANEKGAASGVAELDENGIVIPAQLPSYVDDVLEYEDKDHFPLSGETGKIYLALDTNKTYRWSGSAYVEISPSLALGETSSTAYRGDRGADAYAHAVTNKGSAFAEGFYKITTNSEGHVIEVTAVTKADIIGTSILLDSTSHMTAGQYALDAAAGSVLSQSTNNVRKGLGYQAKLSSGNWRLNSGETAQDGDFVWVNGYLGRATDTITGGSTNIVEHTNWEKVTVGALNDLLTEKADKVAGATSGNFAGLDGNGNLVDSGHKHSDYGTVSSVAAGVGLAGGPVTGSGTIKANLKSETSAMHSSAAPSETAQRQYPVVPDADGYLSVNVPWENTQPHTGAYTWQDLLGIFVWGDLAGI